MTTALKCFKCHNFSCNPSEQNLNKQPNTNISHLFGWDTKKLLFQDGNPDSHLGIPPSLHPAPDTITTTICHGGRAVCFHGNPVPLLPISTRVSFVCPTCSLFQLYSVHATEACWRITWQTRVVFIWFPDNQRIIRPLSSSETKMGPDLMLLGTIALARRCEHQFPSPM